MRRSKGFILAEILISMMLQAGFVIVLCGAFYLLVSFESDVQMKLVARQRGQRVIQYIDQRIRNAGLGFREFSYKDGSKMYYNNTRCFRVALNPFTNTDKDLLWKNTGGRLRLPAAITWRDNDYPDTNGFGSTTETSKKQYGNILTLLYAEREKDINFTIIPISYDVGDNYVTVSSIDIAPGASQDFVYIDIPKTKRIEGNSDFTITGTEENLEKNLSNWTVLAGVGVPLRLIKEDDRYKVNNEKAVILRLKNHLANTTQLSNKNATTVTVHAGDELQYLKCERMFVAKDDAGERNFYFQELKDDWSTKQPYQDGILALYFELYKEKNLLDLWVLASGGQDGKYHERPNAWPSNGRWVSPYFHYHVMYVSHASWKLNNIPNSFDWTK